MESKFEIFFSYAWGDENEQGDSREKIVNELYESLLRDNYHVKRDKYDLGYKGLVSDFTNEIGNGKCIVVAISNKYVRSPYCMFELYEIARKASFDKTQFKEKILPIMVEFIDFTRPNVISELFSFWENEYNEWDSLVKKSAGQLAVEQLQRYDKIKMIYQNFGKLTEWIVDMNTLTPQKLSYDNFSIIKRAIETMAGNDNSKPLPTAYKITNIRKFLENAINDNALNALCMDHFTQVYNNFTDGQNKLQKINLLLDFCKRNFKFNTLLDAMEEINNIQYELYKPYI